MFADDLPRRRPPQIYKPPTAEMIAYLDFSVSTTGMLTGVKVKPLNSSSQSKHERCKVKQSLSSMSCTSPPLIVWLKIEQTHLFNSLGFS